jgi:hypothetical protein
MKRVQPAVTIVGHVVREMRKRYFFIFSPLVAEKVTCPGTPECSGKGTCNTGICECDAPWGGPNCDQSIQIIIQLNNCNSRVYFDYR